MSNVTQDQPQVKWESTYVVQVPKALLACPELSPRAKLLYMALIGWASDDFNDKTGAMPGESWPTRDQLAEMIGWHDVGTVRRALSELEAATLVVSRRQFDRRGRNYHYYVRQFVWDAELLEPVWVMKGQVKQLRGFWTQPWESGWQRKALDRSKEKGGKTPVPDEVNDVYSGKTRVTTGEKPMLLQGKNPSEQQQENKNNVARTTLVGAGAPTPAGEHGLEEVRRQDEDHSLPRTVLEANGVPPPKLNGKPDIHLVPPLPSVPANGVLSEFDFRMAVRRALYEVHGVDPRASSLGRIQRCDDEAERLLAAGCQTADDVRERLGQAQEVAR